MEPPGRKILIVDDEPALLKMMGLYLTRMGYSVMTVDSTDRAWADVESRAGELAGAVIDATMRGLSMQELASKLLASNPSLCVVVASGYPVDMTTLEAAGPGRVQFVQKPFTAETLAGTLRRMIAAQEKGV
jgi:two-component system, cell cycle sensor histidine kinase and response regulator CckA